MNTFLGRRLIAFPLLLLGVSILAMLILALIPGDYLNNLRSDPQVSPELLARMTREFGLDRPWYIQYGHWLRQVLCHFNFGHSFVYRVPVSSLILARLLNTLMLAGAAAFLAWTLALLFGVISASHHNRLVDRLTSAGAFFGLSMPTILSSLLILYLCRRTGWLPVGGMTSLGFETLDFSGQACDILRHLIPPALVMGGYATASLTRQVRSNLLDHLNEQYVLTARAKGVPEYLVVTRHALRNAINPLITLFGFTLSSLVSSSFVVEIIFGWPGLGQLTLDAILRQDLYLVMGCLTLSALIVLVGNLGADLLLIVADPRIEMN
jgi:peptide/nickel transport system permease protein